MNALRKPCTAVPVGHTLQEHVWKPQARVTLNMSTQTTLILQSGKFRVSHLLLLLILVNHFASFPIRTPRLFLQHMGWHHFNWTQLALSSLPLRSDLFDAEFRRIKPFLKVRAMMSVMPPCTTALIRSSRTPRYGLPACDTKPERAA